MSVYDGSVHVFYGPRMWRLTDYGLDSPDYPADTRSIYSHAPSTVDAAVYSTFTHQTYLFSGKTRLFVACQISSGQITAGGGSSPLPIFEGNAVPRTQTPWIGQPSTVDGSTTSSQHVWSSGFLCCGSDGMELAFRLSLGPCLEYRRLQIDSTTTTTSTETHVLIGGLW